MLAQNPGSTRLVNRRLTLVTAIVENGVSLQVVPKVSTPYRQGKSRSKWALSMTRPLFGTAGFRCLSTSATTVSRLASIVDGAGVLHSFGRVGGATDAGLRAVRRYFGRCDRRALSCRRSADHRAGCNGLFIPVFRGLPKQCQVDRLSEIGVRRILSPILQASHVSRLDHGALRRDYGASFLGGAKMVQSHVTPAGCRGQPQFRA